MAFSLSHPNRKINVGVILMNSETEILDVAPIDFIYGLSKKAMEIFTEFPDSLKAEALDMEFHWTSENGGVARMTSGISMMTTSFKECPALDIVLIGAFRPGYILNKNEISFVRKTHDECSAFLTICGGMFALTQAGLLKGLTATAPRFIIAKLRETNPETNWVERRWARDGKTWSSGALLNGLDMMKAFVEDTWKDKKLVGVLTEMGSWPVRNVDYD